MSGGRVCMIVHGPYPVGEPRVARQARAALDAGWEVDGLVRRGGMISTSAQGSGDAAEIVRTALSHPFGRETLWSGFDGVRADQDDDRRRELGGRVAVSGTFDNTWGHAPTS